MTEAIEERIVGLAGEGLSQQRIADAVDVSRFSLRRVLAARAASDDAGGAVEGSDAGIGDVRAADVRADAIVPVGVDDESSGSGVESAEAASGGALEALDTRAAQRDAAGVVAREREVGEAGAVDDLPTVPHPAPRTAERQVARFGALLEAAPVFTSGRELPLAGLLLALPTLQATGLLEAAEVTFGTPERGACGLRRARLDSCV